MVAVDHAGRAALIGLAGRKQSGKDTAAKALTERGYVRVAFADALKQAAYRTDPYVMVSNAPHRLSLVVDRLGWDAAKQIPDVRRLLQRMGDAMRGAVSEDVWVGAAIDGAARHDRAVITDVRYPNEREAIRDAGGIIVKIVRPGQAADDTHPSETNVDQMEADATVVNSGTVEELRTALLQVSGLAVDKRTCGR